MSQLQKDVFDKVLNEVIGFCGQKRCFENVLPTCALVAGVNLPDHEDLFKLLRQKLRNTVTEHVAMVRSADCNSLKTMMKKVIFQLHKVRCSLFHLSCLFT
jgi:hypothetical protein